MSSPPQDNFGVTSSFASSLLSGHNVVEDVGMGLAPGPLDGLEALGMTGISVGLGGGFTLDDSGPPTSAGMALQHPPVSAPEDSHPYHLTLSFLDA